MNIGDVVRLNSGGPKMTVCDARTSKNHLEIEVVWDGKEETCWLPAVCVTLVQRATPPSQTAVEIAAEAYRRAHADANAADAQLTECQRLEQIARERVEILWNLARDAKKTLEQTARGFDNYQTQGVTQQSVPQT